jgi:hypothetical protein
VVRKPNLLDLIIRENEMKYEGWANYHTWNVALWISNDEPLYREALRYLRCTTNPTYNGLFDYVGVEWGHVTDDGVSWTDPTLDHDELDAFVKGLAE